MALIEPSSDKIKAEKAFPSHINSPHTQRETAGPPLLQDGLLQASQSNLHYLILLSRIHKQVQVTVNCSGNPVPVQIAIETALGVPGLPKIVFMCPESFHYSLGRSGMFVFSLDGF